MDKIGTYEGSTRRRNLSAWVLGGAAMLASFALHAANSGTTVTPRLTSVEAGQAQVFTARFFGPGNAPAAGEVVTFHNDACGTFPNATVTDTAVTDANGFASITFTADPAGGVTCILTATAAPATVRFDVLTWKPDQIEMVLATPSLRPAAGARFSFQAAARMGEHLLRNVDITVRAVPGTTGVFLLPGVQAAIANSGQSGLTQFTAVPDNAVGLYEIEVRLGTVVKKFPIYFNSGWSFQALWWVGPTENGWGVSIVQHDDRIFAVIFTYDHQDNPTWYVMPGGSWGTGGASFVGALYQPTGSPFHAYNAAAFKPGSEVGSIRLNLEDPDLIEATYEIQGLTEKITDTKKLVRNAFGPSMEPTPPVHEEMWWGGASQNGWGIPVFQQGRALFSLWYTYGDDGKPRWFSMPDGTWTSSTTFEGRLYATKGSPWLGRVYNPDALLVTDVGPYRLRFHADGTGTFEYTVGNRAGSMPIVRFPF